MSFVFAVLVVTSVAFQMYTTIHIVFERSLLCSPRLHLFDQKYNKNSNIVKYFLQFKIIVFYCQIFLKCNLFCDGKAELFDE